VPAKVANVPPAVATEPCSAGRVNAIKDGGTPPEQNRM
jgi:hypothetical protein